MLLISTKDGSMHAPHVQQCLLRGLLQVVSGSETTEAMTPDNQLAVSEMWDIVSSISLFECKDTPA